MATTTAAARTATGLLLQDRIDEARGAGLEGLARYWEARRDRTDARSVAARRLYGLGAGA